MAQAIVHFEIQAADVERAKTFYQGVFGWEITQWGEQEYWIIHTGRGTYPTGETVGIDGGLLPRRGGAPFEGAPVNAFVCTLQVEDIDATCQAVTAAGGRLVVPKAALGEMGWNAYCKDTEGNIFGLMQTAQAAS